MTQPRPFADAVATYVLAGCQVDAFTPEERRQFDALTLEQQRLVIELTSIRPVPSPSPEQEAIIAHIEAANAAAPAPYAPARIDPDGSYTVSVLRVPCRVFPGEMCVSCGPGTDLLVSALGPALGHLPWADLITGPPRAIPAPTPVFDSPIEKLFWDAHERLQLPELTDMVAQHPVTVGATRYRLDFALVEQRIAFELDGYVWHSTREAWVKDRRRDIGLALQGWRTYRFDGSLVHHNADEAVHMAARIVRGVR